jgi:hypothetical protein
MKKLNISIFAACMVIGLMLLTFVSCDDGSSSGRGSGGPYTVTYRPGEGNGPVPQQSPVAAGTQIILPGQAPMTHNAGKVLDKWRTDSGVDYSPFETYRVNSNVTFTAQWGTGTSSPGTNPGATSGIVGTWRGDVQDGITFIFYSNLTYSLYAGGRFDHSGTYSVAGNTITMISSTEYGTFTATITGDKLIIWNSPFSKIG